MKKNVAIALSIVSCVLGLSMETTMAETINFDQDKTGALPAGWKV